MEKKKWKRFKGEELPESGIKFGDEGDIWRYGMGWCEAYYSGDIETTKDWIIVTPDGGFYKHGAICMTWYRNPEVKKLKIVGDEDTDIVARANWSMAALHRTIMAIKRGEDTPRDPNYET